MPWYFPSKARLNASLREGRSRAWHLEVESSAHRLIPWYPGHKIAVIENEIGSLGVDGALVANAHAEARC